MDLTDHSFREHKRPNARQAALLVRRQLQAQRAILGYQLSIDTEVHIARIGPIIVTIVHYSQAVMIQIRLFTGERKFFQALRGPPY